ncbi:MAG: HupE/UreJ family protein [Desulfofustis sp.]|jgi:hydrogenase/urease accessory protein HupE
MTDHYTRSAPVLCALSAAALLLPSPAWAHLVNTGMGPVYDGIGHLLLTPEDLVPVIALSLYCGLRGPRAGRWAMFMLPAAWCAGGLIGLQLDLVNTLPVPALSFLLLGGLVAADAKLPVQFIAPLAALVGLVHGVLNGLILQSGPGGPAILGIMGALFVLVTLLSALVVSLKRYWARIVVRVMGSWVAACGILMFAWYFQRQIG